MSDEHDLPAGGHRADDVAAYALGALEPAEAKELSRHLESCAELAAFEQVVDQLPASVPAIETPARLRRDVLAAVRADPRATGATTGTTGATAGATEPGRTTGSPAAPPPRARRARPRRRRMQALTAGVAAAVAAIAVAVVLITSSGGPSIRAVQAKVTGPGSAIVRITNDHAVLSVRHLRLLPPGKVYEVWLVRGSRPPAPTRALFDVPADGSSESTSAASAAPGRCW